MKSIKLLAAAAATVGFAATSATAATLDDIKKAGVIKCGVSGGLPGFSAPDDKGAMQGMDADICYALAAGIFGDKSKVKFTPLTAKERFTALSSGEVDVLSRNTTHTLLRDGSLGIDFTYYNYIDGQGFMVKNALGVKSAAKLDGASICVQAGTTTELNMADYFRTNNMKFKPVVYETSQQTREGYDKGACDVLTSDKSQLAALRTELKDPKGSTILPETISKEPLGPVVRQGDDQWGDVVRWTLYGLINADEMGVSSKNLGEMAKSTNPNIKRLLGLEGELGSKIGMPNDFMAKAIAAVGNYDEMYQKHVTPLGLTRAGSVNALWNKGGVLYAPPFR